MKPAAEAMRFEYWKTSPNLLVGFMVARRSKVVLGLAVPDSKSHSMSWRGIPVQAQIRCLTSTCRVMSGSASLNCG